MSFKSRMRALRDANQTHPDRERSAQGGLGLTVQSRALPCLFGVAISMSIASAHAEIHTQTIPSHGLSAPQIEDWSDAVVRWYMHQFDIPGLTVAISQHGRIVYAKGFGYRDISSGNPATYLPMQRWTRSRLGSTSKVLTTMGAMKLMEELPEDFSLTTNVYGQNGILYQSHWRNDQKQGSRRWQPVVDMAIGQNNLATTWYVDGKYTIGSSADLDKHEPATGYIAAPGQDYDTIIAIARGPDNHVWSWYQDGTVALGTPSELGYYGVWGDTKFKATRDRLDILGIGMQKDGYRTFTYYSDGTTSQGTPFDLGAHGEMNYTLTGEPDRYDMVGLAYSKNGKVLSWYSDLTARRGTPNDLDADLLPYEYERRSVPNTIAKWENWRKQTQVRHLLSHTSGMAKSSSREKAEIKYPEINGQYNYVWSHRYMLSTAPRLFEPGTDSSYSNHGIGLVGHLMEEVSGLPFQDYIANTVLAPLGLADYLVPHWSVPFDPQVDSVEYSRDDNGQFSPVVKHNYDAARSAAGAYTGAAQEVLRVLLAADRDYTRPDVLTGSSVLQMQTRPFPITAPNRGLGWKIDCNNDVECGVFFDNPTNGFRLSHDGATDGATAWMVRYESYQIGPEVLDGIQVVVNANVGKGKVQGEFQGQDLEFGTSDLADMAEDLARLVNAFGTGDYDIDAATNPGGSEPGDIGGFKTEPFVQTGTDTRALTR